MDNVLFYLISSCLFLAITREAMGIFFVKKDVPCFMSIIVWVIFCVVAIVGTSIIKIPVFRLFFEICSSFVLSNILYYGTIRKKLLWILCLNLLGMIAETLVGLFFIFIEIRIGYVEILGSFISKIVLLMILIGIKLTNYTRLKRDIPMQYWCVLFCIPLGSIVLLNTVFLLCEESENKNAMVLAMISSALILAINFLIFHIYESLSDRMETQKQQIIFNKQIELYKSQIQEREEANLNIRKMKHDIENHLICIREYLEHYSSDHAKRYIDNLLHGGMYFKENAFINTGNIIVDALLNYKFMIMQQRGIELKNHIEIPYNMKINDADLCIILGNCLDNSIEAVSKIEDRELKYVRIALIYRKRSLLFRIENPYIGKIIRDAKGNLLTTKRDVGNHGLGLNSVQKAVQKYDGQMDMIEKNGIFKVQILLYEISENYF